MSVQIIRPITLKHVENEEVAGLIDGLNLIYTTQYRFIPDTTKLYLNGIKLHVGINSDYIIIDDQTISMNYAPLPGDLIIIDYLRKLSS